MRTAVVLLMAVAVVGLFTGCMSPNPKGSVCAPIQYNLRSPVQVHDESVGTSKMGMSEAQGILGFARGDSSIKAAMENGNISKIHHVDSEILNIMYMYIKTKTIVYGE